MKELSAKLNAGWKAALPPRSQWVGAVWDGSLRGQHPYEVLLSQQEGLFAAISIPVSDALDSLLDAPRQGAGPAPTLGTGCGSGCARGWLATDDPYWPAPAGHATGATFDPPPWVKPSEKAACQSNALAWTAGSLMPLSPSRIVWSVSFLRSDTAEGGPVLRSSSSVATLRRVDGLRVSGL